MAKKSRFRQSSDYSAELKQRTEESTSGNYTTIFKSDAKLPMWKDAEGDHAADIIPWISSENHPNYKEGVPVYKVELWVHKRVGPEKGDYICLRNYGEDCPLCDARTDELAADSPRQKITDSLKGSQRCLYNVIVYTDNQEEKGVQIWEASSYLAENPFKATAKNKRTGERIAYADPDKGKTVTFTVEGTMKSKKINGIVFEDRPDIISDEILDEAYVIEDYLVKPDVEELEKIAKIILGGALDDDSPEPEPPQRRRSTEGASKEETSSEETGEEEAEKEDTGTEASPPTRRTRGRGNTETSSEESKEEPKEETEVPPTRRLRRRG